MNVDIANCRPSDWPEQLPSQFYVGLEEFNRGEFFTCHDTLEALWIPEKRSFRPLYQGIIQIAAGCIHLVDRSNFIGAMALLDRGARRLESALRMRTEGGSIEPEEEALYGVDWPGLILAADRLNAWLREREPRPFDPCDSALLPRVDFVVPK